MSFSWCSGITCVLLFSLSNNYYSACCLSLVYSLSIFGEENIQSFSHKTRQKNPTYNLHTHVLCCQKLWNLWFTLQNIHINKKQMLINLLKSRAVLFINKISKKIHTSTGWGPDTEFSRSIPESLEEWDGFPRSVKATYDPAVNRNFNS